MWCTLVDHHGQLQSDDIAGLLDLHLCRYVQERDLYMGSQGEGDGASDRTQR